MTSPHVYSGQLVRYSQIQVELSGTSADESVRILTDEELKTRTERTSWSIKGTDWDLVDYDLASGGTYTDQDGNQLTLSHIDYQGNNQGNWWYIHRQTIPPGGLAPGYHDRFSVIGKTSMWTPNRPSI